VTSIDGFRPKSDRFLGAVTDSWRLAYATRHWSAARTSASSDALVGRTSTTVSVRSLALIWT
jgi:hypothetical protein